MIWTSGSREGWIPLQGSCAGSLEHGAQLGTWDCVLRCPNQWPSRPFAFFLQRETYLLSWGIIPGMLPENASSKAIFINVNKKPKKVMETFMYQWSVCIWTDVYFQLQPPNQFTSHLIKMLCWFPKGKGSRITNKRKLSLRDHANRTFPWRKKKKKKKLLLD